MRCARLSSAYGTRSDLVSAASAAGDWAGGARRGVHCRRPSVYGLVVDWAQSDGTTEGSSASRGRVCTPCAVTGSGAGPARRYPRLTPRRSTPCSMRWRSHAASGAALQRRVMPKPVRGLVGRRVPVAAHGAITAVVARAAARNLVAFIAQWDPDLQSMVYNVYVAVHACVGVRGETVVRLLSPQV